MKKTLLATTALLMTAGAASADLSWSGEVELGWNDDVEGGVYGSITIIPMLTAELDYGLTASAYVELELFDTNQNGLSASDSDDFNVEDYLLKLEASYGAISFGDQAFAAETLWVSAGDMENDSISEADGETSLLAIGSYGGLTIAVGTVLNTDDFALGGTGTGNFDQLSVGLAYEFGNYSISAAYQEDTQEPWDVTVNDDFTLNEVFGISFSGEFAPFSFTVGYAEDMTINEESIGLAVGYALNDMLSFGAYYVGESVGGDNWGVSADYENGPFAVGVFYSYEQDDAEYGFEGSYAVNNAFTIYAGVIEDEDAMDDGGAYIGGEWDMGNGASLLVSYADVDDTSGIDDFGAQEYNDGATVLVTFKF